MYNYIPIAFSILNICILFISIQNIEIDSLTRQIYKGVHLITIIELFSEKIPYNYL